MWRHGVDTAGRNEQAYRAVLPEEALHRALNVSPPSRSLARPYKADWETHNLDAIYARIEALLDARIEGVAIA